MHGVLNIDKKLIVQFTYKSRDESFKPDYSMIGQYLSNKNESVIVSKSKKFSDVNKACSQVKFLQFGPFLKLFLQKNSWRNNF